MSLLGRLIKGITIELTRRVSGRKEERLMLNDVLCLTWFKKAEPGRDCTPDSKCEHAEPNGNCDACNTVDGRFMEEVNCYASTCDVCGELTMHEELEMNEENQLGTCPECLKKGLKA
jgi:hypothetical protein